MISKKEKHTTFIADCIQYYLHDNVLYIDLDLNSIKILTNNFKNEELIKKFI